MYSVSNAFKEKMRSPIQEHRVTGTIGSLSFSEANIVEGSFSISNQSTDSNDVVLGSCYVGQLNAEFTGINILYGDWINKVITPTFALNLGDSWESVPLGVFTVKEAKHTEHGVQVTAYDNMIKFDKKFKKSHFQSLSGLYNIISQICTDAGVTLGMTSGQIGALPNGSETGIKIYGSTGAKSEFANDITTLRDLLYWVAQTMGCFVTINRAGQLVFRQYTQNVVDVISDTQRIEGATFADYITHYVGIYLENLDDNTEDYYGYTAAALTEELNETNAEIAADQQRILELEADLVEWKRKLDNHECTQQEYDEAVAAIDAELIPLQKDVKQLSKRVVWLQQAIAQSADDGSDMVLGANPLVMASNKTTRDAQRQEILGALSDISYTPFTASVIYGVIYDLGDVIQFSGGLYNSENDSFGCVMSWTYHLNGEVELQGFGVDPAVQLVRTKTQKSADKANSNAINSKEVTNGTGEPPADAKDGDIYVKTKKVRKDTHPLSLNDIHYIGYDIWRDRYTNPINNPVLNFNVVSAVWEQEGYHIELEGMTFSYTSYYFMNANQGAGLIKVPVTELGRYSFHAKIKLESTAPSRRPNDVVGFAIMSDPSDLFGFVPYGQFVEPSWWGGELNLREEQDNYYEYSASFTIPSGIASQGYFYICFMRTGLMTNSGQSTGEVKMSVKEFYITKTTETYDDTHEDAIDEIYNYVVDETTGAGKWLKIDIGSLAGLSDTYINNPTDGQIIKWNASTRKWINQTLNLDFSKVVANPEGTPTDNLTKVSIDGHAYNIAGGGNVNDVKVDNVSVVTNNVANINTMTGATSEANGAKGLVPTPTTADVGKFLKGDGTWADAGTAITPNPQDTATADLTKVGIAGTVYNVKDAGAVRTTQVGVASGVAGLDENGRVPSSQLPSYVDDVVEGYYDIDTDRFYEESTFTTVIPPTDGKSWVDVLTNKSYRWTGSVYVRVDEGVQLGTTHSTAAYGDDAVSTAEPTFTEASTRANLLGTGEKLLVILGKIKKYFSDIKDLAFIAKDGTSSTKYLRGDGTWQALPTIGNGTISVQKNGVAVDSFTVNQTANKTVNIPVDEAVVESISNTTPYLYRQSPAIGTRVMENALVGASVVKNQFAHKTAGTYTNGGITYTVDNVGIVTISGSLTGAYAQFSYDDIGFVEGHVYYMFGCPSGGGSNKYFLDTGAGIGHDNGSGVVGRVPSGYGGNKYLRFYQYSGYNLSGSKIMACVIDLTQMFGTTIADYAYTKEQSTAGSGIAWLKSYGFFTKDYYPYNAGELISVNPSAKKVVGKNLLNPTQHEGTRVKTTNGITFFVNDDGSITCNGTATAQARYYFGVYSTLSYPFDVIFSCENGDTSKACAYLGNNITNSSPKTITAGTQLGTYFVYVPNGATINNYTIKPMFRVADVTDATFEHYHLTIYTFPSQTLRGLFTLVDGELKASGDVYREDGVITRKYGVVDLGSLSWTYVSSETRFFCSPNGIKSFGYSELANIICAKYPTMIWSSVGSTDKVAFSAGGYVNIRDRAYTDAATFKTAMSGVYLVYELATPTTETLTPFDNPQKSFVGGTEEFITENGVPVGHESEYKKLPAEWDDDYMVWLQGEIEQAANNFTYALLMADETSCSLAYTDDYTSVNVEIPLVQTYTDTQTQQNYTVDYTNCEFAINGVDIICADYQHDWVSGAEWKVIPQIGSAFKQDGKLKVSVYLRNWKLTSSDNTIRYVTLMLDTLAFGKYVDSRTL